jgi:hypothetical protein
MEYELNFAVEGERYRLHARTTARGGRFAATLHDEASDGRIVGAGVLEATPVGVVRAAATLRAGGAVGTRESLRALRRGFALLLRHLRRR